MKKIILCYPPGELYQRGEDRCQSNISASAATSVRACNDLGYAAAVLNGICESYVRDYQTAGYNEEKAINDIKAIDPDYFVLSTTNATIFTDIDFVNKVKSSIASDKDIKFILKGAIFWDASFDLLGLLDLTNICVLIGGEIDTIIKSVVENVDNNTLEDVDNIFYKLSDGTFKKNRFGVWEEDLDSIPFPDRSKMPNELYIRPDNGRVMATIQTSRGCPSNCIYCLSPAISGKNVRFRSPENVVAEIKECYEKFGIDEFFFKADTFTINEQWVLKLCNLLKEKKLDKAIHYAANSRVRPISEKVLKAMKETGCYNVAFGFETGSEETMKLIGKGATIEDNIKAMEYAKNAGVSTYGFFMVGFPWENKEHLNDTKNMIYKLNPDFIEIHIALPYYGTKLYDLCSESNTLKDNVLGNDYFHATTTGTKYLSMDELLKFRQDVLSHYYTRPKYIWKKLVECHFAPKIVFNYAKYGIRLLTGLAKR